MSAPLHTPSSPLLHQKLTHGCWPPKSSVRSCPTAVEAFEEICLVSEALREDSQALRSHAAESLRLDIFKDGISPCEQP